MMPRQAALLEKARRSVEAAESLSADGHHDFAASRAYYAMFYLAVALLLGKGLAFSKPSAVNAAFGEHFAKPGIVPPQLHRYLLRAEEVRVVGDYEAEGEVSADQVRELLLQAGEFIQVAEDLLVTNSSTDG
jgi:uncharacterized protein (UPF0332 family)